MIITSVFLLTGLLCMVMVSLKVDQYEKRRSKLRHEQVVRRMREITEMAEINDREYALSHEQTMSNIDGIMDELKTTADAWEVENQKKPKEEPIEIPEDFSLFDMENR